MVAKQMLELGATRSCIRELFEYGMQRAKVVGRENVYDYSIGNPSIPAPDGVKNAIVELATEFNSVTLHSYTSASGCDAVKQAVAEDLNQRYGTKIRPQNLFFTCGAAPALLSVIRALAVENAEIVAIAPYFPEYRPFCTANGVKLVVAEADVPNFQINFEKLEACITPNTQAVIVNSPNNPTGVIYSRETLCRLAELLERKSAEYGKPIYILADEPYRELVYDGAEVTFIPTVYRNTIVCYSYSKSLSLPGERIGYVCVSDEAEDSQNLMLAVAGAARSAGHVCAPSIMQYVVAHCATLRPDMRAYDQNRRTLYDALTSYGYECVKPEGAFYLFVKAPNGDANVFSKMAMEEDLLVVPGDAFGCPGYVRLSTCVSHDMILRSLPAFQRMMEKLGKSSIL